MADPILVSTAEQLMTAYNNTIRYMSEDATIKVIGDIDFNRGQYSDLENNFFVGPYFHDDNKTLTLDGSWEDSSGNIQNRVLSNIFLYPNKSLFYSEHVGGKGTLYCKNLTFEIVSNNGKICTMSQYKHHTFENCIFNVRLYSLNNTQFYMANDNNRNSFLTFKNCVFNFYITTCLTNNVALISVPYSTRATNVWPVTVKSCIFKIRNATDKFITLIDNGLLAAKIHNSAIFYNDIGTVQPAYSTDKNGNYEMINCHHIFNPTNFNKSNQIINTYISSFSYYPLPSGFVKPIILAFNYNPGNGCQITDCISTSFYDGSKVEVYMNNTYGTDSPVDNYTGLCTKLTTAQCKDPVKLSEIGYIFSEAI